PQRFLIVIINWAYEDKCYYFSTDRKSWDDARTDCVGRGSHLMNAFYGSLVGTEIFWIGLNDIAAEGVWEWTDGSTFLPFLAYWKPGNPDNWEDNEDCGEVVGGEKGQWNDDVCTSLRKFISELSCQHWSASILICVDYLFIYLFN
uniref:C-type lectin domain-containing protein n=1 Tax=Salmo trutta TaxID=8032 RepID=A0A673Y588_SALTR